MSISILSKIRRELVRENYRRKALKAYRKYQNFTMVSELQFCENILLAKQVEQIKGCVIECGVWKGGMIAGLTTVLGQNRKYHLFDSFEGLPEAAEIDGKLAKRWQADTKGAFYYDNCKASEEDAFNTMKLTGVPFQIHRGWFEKTIPQFIINEPIALLRLDADWYDSTMICLDYFFPHIAKGGMIIIEDYYIWEGCSKAVHDFLSKTKSNHTIHESRGGICFIKNYKFQSI